MVFFVLFECVLLWRHDSMSDIRELLGAQKNLFRQVIGEKFK